MKFDKVVIFDGVCNMCNASVNFVLDHNKKNNIGFTANQNDAGKAILEEHGVDSSSVESVYLFEGGKLYTKSTAALRVSSQLSFPWNLGVMLLIFPRFLRDWVYDWIARNRYKWFGKRDTCRLPTPEERARFLD